MRVLTSPVACEYSPCRAEVSSSMKTPLQAARQAKGWSQVAAVSRLISLANQRKISVASAQSLKTQLSRWENGHVTPAFYQALLCELYGSSPLQLGFGIQELPTDLS